MSPTLPPSFADAPGSSTLDGEPFPDPTIVSTRRSTGAGPSSLTLGPHTMTFEANAGIGLGPATATVSTSISGTVTSLVFGIGTGGGWEEPPQVDNARTRRFRSPRGSWTPRRPRKAT